MTNALLLRRRGMMMEQEKEDKYLTFTAAQSGTVQVVAGGTAPVISLEYSLDGISWQPYTVGDTITLANDGDFVKFRGVNTKIITNIGDYNRFKVLGDIKGSGDITSILNGVGGDHKLLGNDFINAFDRSTGLIEAPNLPSLRTVSQCYYGMFSRCSRLTKVRIEANNIATNALKGWLYGVASAGVLECKQSLNLPGGTNGLPTGWTRVDI